MADLEQQRLIALLTDPRETLAIEYKSWLDLKVSKGKATLAKAAIALANHGGGTIVLGMAEEGSGFVSTANPYNRYDTDIVNSSISQYAEPPFHCELGFADHPMTGNRHAIVIVPGTVTVPVMTKKGSEIFDSRKYFIRKPGPKSEEPTASAEWQALIDRCVRANRTDMLDAIRGIVLGETVAAPTGQTEEDSHKEYLAHCRQRWTELVSKLPSDDPGHLRNGHYEIAFSILGFEGELSLAALRETMKLASNSTSTVWYLFTDRHNRAEPIGKTIETLYRDPGERQHSLEAWYYWTAKIDASFYLIRGYQEDDLKQTPWFHYTLPIWRIGQAMQYASIVCSHLGDDTEFFFSTQFAGLTNRRLSTGHDYQDFSLDLLDSFTLSPGMQLDTLRLSARQVEDNLAEILFNLLHPLYQQFSYFELQREFVAKEVRAMRISGK